MNLKNKLAEAYNFFRNGQLDQSEIILKKIVKKFPTNVDAISNLSIILIQKKKYEQAVKYLNFCLKLNFDLKIARNLSNLYFHLKDWESQLKLFHQEKNNIQTDFEILINVAIALRETKNINQSLGMFEELLKKFSNEEKIYISYGFTLNSIDEYKEAVRIYLQGLEKNQNSMVLKYNLGIAYANQSLAAKAIEYLEMTQEINKNNYDYWITLAAQKNILRDFNGVDECLINCKKIDPKNHLTDFQIATTQLQRGNLDLSEKKLKKLLEINSHDIEANYHLGLINLMKNNYQVSDQHYKYRCVRERNHYGKFDDTKVETIDPNSNILIGWEQGIGDELIFLRLLPEFLKNYKKVTYITQNKLYDLLKFNFPEVNLVKESDSEEYTQGTLYDVKINVGSLIRFIDNIEIKLAGSKFLSSIKRRTNVFNNDKPIIGISWKSKNEKIGSEKSIKVENLKPLISLDKFNFVNLQYGDVTEDIELMNSWSKNKVFHDDQLDYYNDISGLVSLISECDIVITTSNVTAHLAGSLGIKAYVLIPKSFGKLWYWYEDSQKSTWYPTIELISQLEDRSWSEVIEKVKLKIINQFS